MTKSLRLSTLAAIAVVLVLAAGGITLDRAVADIDPEVVLYQFEGLSHQDGGSPTRALIADSKGALYGTTAFGGRGTGQGNGTVFKIMHSISGGYAERVLYRFQGLSHGDGSQAEANLVADASGNIYGTTVYGGSAQAGSAGGGVVFKLAPLQNGRYAETVLYRFAGSSVKDGSQPYAGVILDPTGSLFGTTAFGGNGSGTVFKLTPVSGGGYQETVIYKFKGAAQGDGANPYSDLIRDDSGALYGATTFGGSTMFGRGGGGTVFKLTPTNNGYVESVLYRFLGSQVNDGAFPVARLMLDQSGSLYGTTEAGGDPNAGDHGNGGGTVFKLTPSPSGYTESVLYEFHGPANGDGYFPQCAMIEGIRGRLFGTVSFGGVGGNGIVFSLTPTRNGYAETILYTFRGTASGDGAQPYSTLIAGPFNGLSGTTLNGGQGNGTVFRILP